MQGIRQKSDWHDRSNQEIFEALVKSCDLRGLVGAELAPLESRT
jgi:hypothetical protein